MAGSPVLVISMFRDVKLRLEFTIQMRRNWTQGQNHVISLATQRNLKASSFIVLKLTPGFMKLTMLGSLKIKILQTYRRAGSFFKKLIKMRSPFTVILTKKC